MNSKGIRRDSLSEQISDSLEKMIEKGIYSVGEKIPTEAELMEKFSVGRNTIREAVRSLTWAGVLEIRQGDGTYVCSRDRFHANMSKKYEEVSIRDIKEARKCIEVTVAHLAALRINDKDRENITRAYEKRNNMEGDIKEYTRADVDFHMAIAEACHNIILIDIYKSISDYLLSHISERKHDTKLDSEEIERLHRCLYEAVLAGKSDDAAVYAKEILKI